MSIFSTNQARQFYVASAVSSDRISSASSTGAIKCMVENNNEDSPINFWFEYMSPAGPVRSDIIPVNHVRAIKATNAADMRRPYMAKSIVLQNAMKNSSYVVGGCDCILNVTIQNYENAGSEYRIHKFGAVHTVSTMTHSAFYIKMAQSLASGLARDANKILKVYVTTSGDPVEVTPTTDLSGTTATGIVLAEAEQSWKLGKIINTSIDFILNDNTVIVDHEEIHWATITDATNASVYGQQKNGRDTADLEWFCMGERGDIYRGAGWPNNWDTTYQVNASSEYDYVDIHYYFQGEGVSVQQSEKTITIVAPFVNPTHILATLLPATLTAALTDKGAKMYPSSINDLKDVSVSSPSDGQVLKYDGTDKVWENGADATA